jgi:prepilin-type processing-associated H-X9-DG protein
MWDHVVPSFEKITSAQPWYRAPMGLPFNHVPGGGNVLWLDGSVEFLTVERWADANLPERPVGIDYIDPKSVLQIELPEEPPVSPRPGARRRASR